MTKKKAYEIYIFHKNPCVENKPRLTFFLPLTFVSVSASRKDTTIPCLIRISLKRGFYETIYKSIDNSDHFSSQFTRKITITTDF